MSGDSRNHKMVRYYLDHGKAKSAVAYANGIEGEERILELNFILSHCLVRGRINDSVDTARMLGRKLTVLELEQLSQSINNQNRPELLNNLRKTDNLPNPKELSRIFAPYVEYLEQQKKSSKG